MIGQSIFTLLSQGDPKLVQSRTVEGIQAVREYVEGLRRSSSPIEEKLVDGNAFDFLPMWRWTWVSDIWTDWEGGGLFSFGRKILNATWSAVLELLFTLASLLWEITSSVLYLTLSADFWNGIVATIGEQSNNVLRGIGFGEGNAAVLWFGIGVLGFILAAWRLFRDSGSRAIRTILSTFIPLGMIAAMASASLAEQGNGENTWGTRAGSPVWILDKSKIVTESLGDLIVDAGDQLVNGVEIDSSTYCDSFIAALENNYRAGRIYQAQTDIGAAKLEVPVQLSRLWMSTHMTNYSQAQFGDGALGRRGGCLWMERQTQNPHNTLAVWDTTCHGAQYGSFRNGKWEEIPQGQGTGLFGDKAGGVKWSVMRPLLGCESSRQYSAVSEATSRLVFDPPKVDQDDGYTRAFLTLISVCDYSDPRGAWNDYVDNPNIIHPRTIQHLLADYNSPAATNPADWIKVLTPWGDEGDNGEAKQETDINYKYRWAVRLGGSHQWAWINTDFRNLGGLDKGGQKDFQNYLSAEVCAGLIIGLPEEGSGESVETKEPTFGGIQTSTISGSVSLNDKYTAYCGSQTGRDEWNRMLNGVGFTGWSDRDCVKFLLGGGIDGGFYQCTTFVRTGRSGDVDRAARTRLLGGYYLATQSGSLSGGRLVVPPTNLGNDPTLVAACNSLRGQFQAAANGFLGTSEGKTALFSPDSVGLTRDLKHEADYSLQAKTEWEEDALQAVLTGSLAERTFGNVPAYPTGTELDRALNGLERLHGRNTVIARAILALMALITAAAYMFSLIGLAAGTVLSQFIIAIIVILLPVVLLVVAMPFASTKQIAPRLVKLFLGALLTYSVFYLVLTLVLVVTLVLADVVAAAADPGSWTRALGVALVPIISIKAVAWLLKQAGLNITGFKGALATTSGMAMAAMAPAGLARAEQYGRNALRRGQGWAQEQSAKYGNLNMRSQPNTALAAAGGAGLGVGAGAAALGGAAATPGGGLMSTARKNKGWSGDGGFEAANSDDKSSFNWEGFSGESGKVDPIGVAKGFGDSVTKSRKAYNQSKRWLGTKARAAHDFKRRHNKKIKLAAFGAGLATGTAPLVLGGMAAGHIAYRTVTPRHVRARNRQQLQAMRKERLNNKIEDLTQKDQERRSGRSGNGAADHPDVKDNQPQITLPQDQLLDDDSGNSAASATQGQRYVTATPQQDVLSTRTAPSHTEQSVSNDLYDQDADDPVSREESKPPDNSFHVRGNDGVKADLEPRERPSAQSAANDPLGTSSNHQSQTVFIPPTVEQSPVVRAENESPVTASKGRTEPIQPMRRTGQPQNPAPEQRTEQPTQRSRSAEPTSRTPSSRKLVESRPRNVQPLTPAEQDLWEAYKSSWTPSTAPPSSPRKGLK